MCVTFVLEGTLLRVLQISRIMGGAPLDITRNGQSTRVSSKWYIYSCVAASVLNLLSFVLNYFMQYELMHKSQIFMALKVSQNVLLSLRVFLGSFASFKRMSSLALQINGLEKVFQEFKKKSTSANRQNKVLILTVLLILLTNIIKIACFVEHSANIYVTGFSVGDDIVVFCQLMMSVLQEFQVVLVNMRTAEGINVLKVHLRQLLREKRSVETMEEEIRRVGRSYLNLYEVASQNNKYESGVIFLMFATIIASLVNAGFVFADDLNNLDKSHLSFDTLVIIAVPSVASIYRIIIFTRSCHQIHKEVIEMNIVVSELVYATAVGQQLPVVVDMLVKQLQLARPVFSVLGIFTAKQSTLTTILSAWVTYTVILIQVRSKQSSR